MNVHAEAFDGTPDVLLDREHVGSACTAAACRRHARQTQRVDGGVQTLIGKHARDMPVSVQVLGREEPAAAPLVSLAFGWGVGQDGARR